LPRYETQASGSGPRTSMRERRCERGEKVRWRGGEERVRWMGEVEGACGRCDRVSFRTGSSDAERVQLAVDELARPPHRVEGDESRPRTCSSHATLTAG